MSSEVVTKSKRKECWESRDMFYACLDSNNQDESKCKDLRKKYENACPKTWVDHFDRGRRRDIYINKIASEEAKLKQ